MAEAPPDASSEVLELHQVLEAMIENVDIMTVELTCMAHDMVSLVTSPELLVGLEMLEDAYLRCVSAVRALGDQAQDMENTDGSGERATSTASTDLESIVKRLDSLSHCMDQLALRTQLMQCDLIVCVRRPDKLVCLKDQDAVKKQQQQQQQQQQQRPA